jgi:hypothetical protein
MFKSVTKVGKPSCMNILKIWRNADVKEATQVTQYCLNLELRIQRRVKKHDGGLEQKAECNLKYSS